MTDRLTAVEAAARLGVKRETLYAYVSRGLLDRTLSLDGRTSLFDAAQIDELRASRRRPARGELRTIITTSITEVSERGHRYRGVPISELGEWSFESVANLIWADDRSWSGPVGLRSAVTAATAALPQATPLIDRLRVGVAVASGLDPLRHNPTPSAHAAAGRSMVLAATYALGGPTASTPGSAPSIAEEYTAAVADQAIAASAAEAARAVDLALILLADHGLAASTFSARIAASVRADPYSIVAAGMGPIGGRLHGAASRDVHELLVAAAADGVDVALGRSLATGQRPPGVGHAIYVDLDPRERLLSERIREIWSGSGHEEQLATVEALRSALQLNGDLVVNIDFALGALTWLLGAPVWAGEALFAIARIVGWTAHGIEELAEAPARFRPTARYVESPDPATLEIIEAD